jgi:hypothetical protein
MSKALPPRQALLERVARETAHDWARAYFSELAEEGRRVEGGWPGTMPEARMRATTRATTQLAASAMTPLTNDERSQLARLTYKEARRSWQAASAGTRRPR